MLMKLVDSLCTMLINFHTRIDNLKYVHAVFSVHNTKFGKSRKIRHFQVISDDSRRVCYTGLTTKLTTSETNDYLNLRTFTTSLFILNPLQMI